MTTGTKRLDASSSAEFQAQIRLRRQWAILPQTARRRPNWALKDLASKFKLHAHPDLPIESRLDATAKIFLLGNAVDIRAPEASPLSTLSRSSHEAVVEWLDHIAGLYVVVFVQDERIFIYTDPSGLMGVYYKGTVAASTISLIPGAARDAFLDGEFSLSTHNGFYPGSLCPYLGVKALMANHCLELNTGANSRFWPREAAAPIISEPGALKLIASQLQATMRGLQKQGSILISLTDGRDSRINLATAREWINNVEFFTVKHSLLDKRELEYAAALARDFKLNYREIEIGTVSDSLIQAYDEIKAGMCYSGNEALLGALAQVAGPRRIHISGVLGEGLRAELWPSRTPMSTDAKTLARRLYSDTPDVIIEGVDEWRRSLPKKLPPRQVFNQLFWEQWGGRWIGTEGNSSSIFYAPFTLFNNREMMRLIHGLPDATVFGGTLPFTLIEMMWPELMRVPFLKTGRAFGKNLPRWLKSAGRKLMSSRTQKNPSKSS